MLEVFLWTLIALALLLVIPDSWSARHKIAERQARALRESRRARTRAKPDQLTWR